MNQGRATQTSADAGEMLQVPSDGDPDPAQLALERIIFFKQTPVMLGLSSDLPGAKWVVATNETGLRISMTRLASGSFRAFLNRCRHSGRQVVATGRGEGGSLVAPFTDGAIRYRAFDRGELGGKFRQPESLRVFLRELPSA